MDTNETNKKAKNIKKSTKTSKTNCPVAGKHKERQLKIVLKDIGRVAKSTIKKDLLLTPPITPLPMNKSPSSSPDLPLSSYLISPVSPPTTAPITTVVPGPSIKSKGEMKSFEKESRSVEVTPSPLPKYIEISTQTDEEVVSVGIDQGTQTKSPRKIISEIREIGCQTEVMDSVPKKFAPFEAKRLTGTGLGWFLKKFPKYEAIEVIEKTPIIRQVFKTEWIQISNPYWEKFRKSDELRRVGGKGFIISDKDNERVYVESQDNGAIWATRAGTKVVIQYPDNSDGDYLQLPPLIPLSVGPITSLCVPTEYIPLECEYWYNLLEKLKFGTKGFSSRLRSPDDGVVCWAHVEVNGRVEVSRNGVRVCILEGKRI